MLVLLPTFEALFFYFFRRCCMKLSKGFSRSEKAFAGFAILLWVNLLDGFSRGGVRTMVRVKQKPFCLEPIRLLPFQSSGIPSFARTWSLGSSNRCHGSWSGIGWEGK